MHRIRIATALAVCLAASYACNGGPRPSTSHAAGDAPRAEATSVEGVSASAAEGLHRGPRVEMQDSGPARFSGPLFDAWSADRAMAILRFLDARLRSPGSEDYDESIDALRLNLEQAGFGAEDGLTLRELSVDLPEPAWNPRSASLRIVRPNGDEEVLHAFDDLADPDRCMLPRNSRSASVKGLTSPNLDYLGEGEILLGDMRVRPDVIKRAARKGAAAVVSYSLSSVNDDPTGADRHHDAIQYRQLEEPPEIPVVQISRASYDRIQLERMRSGTATLAFDAVVESGPATARVLVAEIVGRTHPEEAVVLVAHVQEPGANINASGAAGQLENALTYVRLVREGVLEWPDRTVVFLWGPELLQSRAWLAQAERTPVAAIDAVMVGESRAQTGAIALLERHPDPGAVTTIAPDEHTSWGAGDVEEEWLVPNGLAVIARCALADVSAHCGGWETSENPWEGGTDHDVFIAAGVPSALFWHFTDFTFHTSLDRAGMVDRQEMRRMSTAAMATALAMASPRPTDLDRYLDSLLDEVHARVDAAEAADEPDVAVQWNAWRDGARHWLRRHCLGTEPAEAGSGR